MPAASGRERLLKKQRGFYEPEELADAVLALLEFMEHASNITLPSPSLRRRTGLTNAAVFRGKPSGETENAITDWIAESFANAESQVRDFVKGHIPDVVFAFEADVHGRDVSVVLEAKPVWQRWITTGLKPFSGQTTDEIGRATGTYCSKNLRQVLLDRDKLLSTYTDARDRLMLLALVFQRPGEVDDRLREAMGPTWACRIRHVVDRCNPPGDNIGVTGMVFWPER